MIQSWLFALLILVRGMLYWHFHWYIRILHYVLHYPTHSSPIPDLLVKLFSYCHCTPSTPYSVYIHAYPGICMPTCIPYHSIILTSPLFIALFTLLLIPWYPLIPFTLNIIESHQYHTRMMIPRAPRLSPEIASSRNLLVSPSGLLIMSTTRLSMRVHNLI